MNIIINKRVIGEKNHPYIIAEMSANHNGKIENALQIIEAAKKAGADAVKMQTYTPDTITLNSANKDFQIHGGLWDGYTLYDLYKKAHTPWEWHKRLFDYARKIGITIFSSPFDMTAVDFLEELNTPAYKIASFEAIDLPLIRYVAQTKKPMIISTGIADKEEIKEAVEAAKSNGCEELVLLHCVSGYPASPSDYNLKTLIDMREKFDVLVGLSDHTISNTTAIASVALGACIIEKHFTIDRNGGGPDDSFSLEPQDLKALCEDTKSAWEAVGRVDYGLKSSEQGNIKFRRSLYFVKDMKMGEIIDETCIRSVRPGYGLAPKYYDNIIGMQVACDIKKFSPVKYENINFDNR